MGSGSWKGGLVIRGLGSPQGVPSLNRKVKVLRPNLQHDDTNQVGATGFLVMAGSYDQSVVAVGLGQKRIYKATLKDELDAGM